MGAAPKILHLVDPQADPQVIATLRKLLAQAEAGQIVGLAYIAMMPGWQYSGDLVGLALQQPLVALGLASALEHQITTFLQKK